MSLDAMQGAGHGRPKPLPLSRDEQLAVASQMDGSDSDSSYGWLLDMAPGTRTIPGWDDDVVTRHGDTTTIRVGADDPIYVRQQGSTLTATQDGDTIGSAVRHGASLVVRDYDQSTLFTVTTHGRNVSVSDYQGSDAGSVSDSGKLSTVYDWGGNELEQVRWTPHGASLDDGGSNYYGSISAKGSRVNINDSGADPAHLELHSAADARTAIGQEAARIASEVDVQANGSGDGSTATPAGSGYTVTTPNNPFTDENSPLNPISPIGIATNIYGMW
jgi:hypothetical protein